MEKPTRGNVVLQDLTPVSAEFRENPVFNSEG